MSRREYNKRTFYDCSEKPFPDCCSSPALNPPSMPIDDSSRPNKRARYTPDPLRAAIYVASGKSIRNLTTPSDSPQVILLPSDTPDTDHITMRDKPGRATEKT